MRIAYFTDTFLPQINGIATSLANQARELGEKGHDVLIFAPKLDNIKREKFKAKNVTVIHLPAVSAFVYPEYKVGFFGLPKVIKYLVKFKPDIIHLHTPLTVGMDAIIASRILKKPLVGTVHMSYVESNYLQWLKYKLAVKLADKAMYNIQNFMFNQCDLVIAPSKLLREELSRNDFKKPIFYLPNGVLLKDPKFLTKKSKNNLKRKYHLKDKVVLHFGRLSQEKEVEVLIKAFHLLVKNHSDVSLLIIGDGPTKEGLVKLVKRLNLEKEVIFTGFIEHQLLISSGLLCLGDLFATASTMENNPMAVLEAMAFGLPVVGVKQAGLIELVSSNGFLVKPGDIKSLAEKMETILFDPALSSKMGKKSAEVVKGYSIDKTTDKLLGVYQTLLRPLS